MVTNRSLHRCQHILTVIRVGQGQDTLPLMLAIPLFFDQSLQEAKGDVSQFAEPLTQLFHLSAVIFGWTMLRIDAFFPGLSQIQQVPRQFPDVTVVDNELGLGNAHRKHLAYQLPWNGVLVVLVGDAAFCVHDAIHHPRRVIVVLGKRQQVRSLFGVRIHGALLGGAVDPHIGHVGQPPTRDFVEVLEAAEGAAIEQAQFHIMELPLDFSLGQCRQLHQFYMVRCKLFASRTPFIRGRDASSRWSATARTGGKTVSSLRTRGR